MTFSRTGSERRSSREDFWNFEAALNGVSLSDYRISSDQTLTNTFFCADKQFSLSGGVKSGDSAHNSRIWFLLRRNDCPQNNNLVLPSAGPALVNVHLPPSLGHGIVHTVTAATHTRRHCICPRRNTHVDDVTVHVILQCRPQQEASAAAAGGVSSGSSLAAVSVSIEVPVVEEVSASAIRISSLLARVSLLHAQGVRSVVFLGSRYLAVVARECVSIHALDPSEGAGKPTTNEATSSINKDTVSSSSSTRTSVTSVVATLLAADAALCHRARRLDRLVNIPLVDYPSSSVGDARLSISKGSLFVGLFQSSAVLFAFSHESGPTMESDGNPHRTNTCNGNTFRGPRLEILCEALLGGPWWPSPAAALMASPDTQLIANSTVIDQSIDHIGWRIPLKICPCEKSTTAYPKSAATAEENALALTVPDIVVAEGDDSLAGHRDTEHTAVYSSPLAGAAGSDADGIIRFGEPQGADFIGRLLKDMENNNKANLDIFNAARNNEEVKPKPMSSIAASSDTLISSSREPLNSVKAALDASRRCNKGNEGEPSTEANEGLPPPLPASVIANTLLLSSPAPSDAACTLNTQQAQGHLRDVSLHVKMPRNDWRAATLSVADGSRKRASSALLPAVDPRKATRAADAADDSSQRRLLLGSAEYTDPTYGFSVFATLECTVEGNKGIQSENKRLSTTLPQSAILNLTFVTAHGSVSRSVTISSQKAAGTAVTSVPVLSSLSAVCTASDHGRALCSDDPSPFGIAGAALITWSVTETIGAVSNANPNDLPEDAHVVFAVCEERLCSPAVVITNEAGVKILDTAKDDVSPYISVSASPTEPDPALRRFSQIAHGDWERQKGATTLVGSPRTGDYGAQRHQDPQTRAARAVDVYEEDSDEEAYARFLDRHRHVSPNRRVPPKTSTQRKSPGLPPRGKAPYRTKFVYVEE